MQGLHAETGCSKEPPKLWGVYSTWWVLIGSSIAIRLVRQKMERQSEVA